MRKLIIAFLILTLALVACEGQGGETGAEGVPFIGGTSGVMLSYVEDAPPAEVYDGGDFPFDIEIMLQNDGEKTVAKEDVIVSLSGIDPAEFGKIASDFKKNPPSDLEAKYKDSQGNIIDSIPVFVSFTDLNHDQWVTGDLSYPIFGSVCYKYGTDALSRICVKDDLQTKGGVCEVAGDKPVLNSGAPVQVSSLTETIIGTNKIRLTFKIQHSGSGQVFAPDTQCNALDRREDINNILVSVNTGIPGLVCDRLDSGTDTSGMIRLTNGLAVLSCEQPLTASGSFLKTVDVKLDYDYEEDVVANLVVKHSE